MIILYFILVLLIGLYKSRPKDTDDYLFSSRKITLPSFVATLVTTWYGGILEIGRFTFENGIVTWVIFGLFYYIAALFYAFFIAPSLRTANINSIPAYFDRYYGQNSKLISATIMLFISSPAPYIMILSTVITHLYNISFSYAIIISTFTSIIYIYIGGYKSIIRTDKLQFMFMFGGFITMLYYLISTYGGIGFLIENVPQKNMSITGNLPIGYILSWLLISCVTLIDPSIFQRTYSGNNLKVVKNGFLISIIFWFIFDILTISTGLYASAIIKTSDIAINPYLYLSDNILPPIAKNIFYISIISIVMSTIDSFTFVSSFTIGKDMFNNNTLKNTRYGIIITSILSIIIVYNFKTAIDIWYIFGSIAASSLLIPFLLMIFKEQKRLSYPELCLILPIITNLIWIYLDYPFNIDSMYPGILISGVLNYLLLNNFSNNRSNIS